MDLRTLADMKKNENFVLSLWTCREQCGYGKDTDVDLFEMLADACGTDTEASVRAPLGFFNPSVPMSVHA